MDKINNIDNLRKIELTSKEKAQLVIQSAIQAIPYVGGSIATLYFGRKQEIRFERLESFFRELAEEIKEIKGKIKSIEIQDKEAFIFILESLNEKVEIEYSNDKRKFFKNYFKNTLKEPINELNFNERRYFLDVLGLINILECKILKILIEKGNVSTQIKDIKIESVDIYAIIGAIEKLKSYGFLESYTLSVRFGTEQDNRIQEKVRLSNYGKKFYEFCIE